MRKLTILSWPNAILAIGLVIIILSLGQDGQELTEKSVDTPTYVPSMIVPVNNPLSKQKITLGRHLFYDQQLSVNGSISCSSCHIQKYAFTDKKALSPGATGELTKRNSMSLTNVAYNGTFTWADNTVLSLEQQALMPLKSVHPVEMGIEGHETEILARFKNSEQYGRLFEEAFPDDNQRVTLNNVIKALASFQRTMVSFDSPYDHYLQGDDSALSPAAERGKLLFFSERTNCFRCHGGYNLRFSLGQRIGDNDQSVAYHNTGLYNLNTQGDYPEMDQGLIEVTNIQSDMGKFKAPTLRNIALTDPYMHDGSITTLTEVLDHYASGGRLIKTDPYAGNGSQNPYKSNLIKGFNLSDSEREDIIAFLHSLTDEVFIKNPELSDPSTLHGS